MALRKEVGDLLSEEWGQDSASEQVAWARQSMRTLLAAAEDPESHISIASFLATMQLRGASGAHLAGFASVIRETGRSIHFSHPNVVDTCGTGGGAPSLNISTGAALLAAAAGAKVAKHGNRAVTSSIGSADLLEALGITITSDEDRLQACMDQTGFAFLFAPHFFSALRWIRPIRVSLGIRTVFNQLGPLLNPAGAKRQIIGVFHRSLIEPTTTALALGGAEEAIVACGQDGLDELSPCEASWVQRISGGSVHHLEVLEPEDLGFERATTEAAGPSETTDESAQRILTALSDPTSPEHLVILPSAAYAVHLSLGLSMGHAKEACSEAASRGDGIAVVKNLAELTN